MPPIRSLYVTTPPTQPTMGPVTTLQRLRDLYNDTLKGFVPADLVKALLPSQDVTMPLTTVLPAGAVGEFAEQNLAEPVKRTLKAYHGSPHDFDSFSLSKIGTGEGAQAYGHGLYFAENRGVAEDYRKQLTTHGRYNLYVNGELVSFPDAAKKAFGDKVGGDIAHYFESGDALRRADMDKAETLLGLKAKLTEQGHQVELRPKGGTYEVNIHASPDELLDWDKPLSQQPPKVQEALESLHYPNGPISTPMKVDKSARTGGELYSAMHENYTGTPERAAELLKAKGIKGIQYLDQGSRQVGVGFQ